MPRNNKSSLKAVFFGLTILATIFFFKVASAQEKDEKSLDYRIKVIIDTVQKTPYVITAEREIRFMSPEGRILKTLPYKNWQDKIGVFISPTLKCMIKAKDVPARFKKSNSGQLEKLKEAKVEFTYINAKGEQKWKKNFEIIYTLEEMDETSIRPYFFVFSRDGSRIVFVKNGTFISEWEYPSDIFVYDTLGNEVASVYKTHGIENDGYLKISPDGKIIVAEVFFPPKDSAQISAKHLLFLDVETGRTKVVKAEGERWSGYGFPLDNKRIQLATNKHPKSITIPFDELPDDLLVLFK
ncbi:MAG: hypothetical protein OEZ20_05165 [candidate division WOR-3 bacterium]|nr:hypothetical protein [candidate division WOR-3 bacterium]MDH5683835.1 hypothetical protein [candidate division WOR-3 bacterium]